MAKIGSTAAEEGLKTATDYFWTGNEIFRNTIRSSKTRDHVKKPGYDYSYWHFMNRSKRQVFQPPAMNVLDRINIPTLIVIGEYDLEACIEIADIMEEKIEGSTKVSMEGAGHCMNMDKPEEFNRIVIDFIKKID